METINPFSPFREAEEKAMAEVRKQAERDRIVLEILPKVPTDVLMREIKRRKGKLSTHFQRRMFCERDCRTRSDSELDECWKHGLYCDEFKAKFPEYDECS